MVWSVPLLLSFLVFSCFIMADHGYSPFSHSRHEERNITVNSHAPSALPVAPARVMRWPSGVVRLQSGGRQAAIT